MALYLVQHGKSLPKDIDPEQGLSEEGIEKVTLIAGVARNYHVRVTKILHSGKKRAARTAAILAAALMPPQGVSESGGLNPLDDVSALAPQLDSGEHLMLVGHLPFMERLVSLLTTGEEHHTIFKFQNGGIVCLDRETDGGQWFIKWALMPEIGLKMVMKAKDELLNSGSINP
jgi:phosphohistidine phosphatase